MSSKFCFRCKITKDVSEFYRDIKYGVRSECKLCTKEKNSVRKGKYVPRSARSVEKKYGISLEEYRALLAVPCAICGTKKNLGLDHNHKTGKIRKALCHHCNVGIGHFKEDIKLIMRAVEYLYEHK